MAIGAQRVSYLYIDDAGHNWIVKLAEDKVNAVTPSPSLNPFNPASPPSGGIQGVINPKRCRQVHAQGNLPLTEEGGRLIKRSFVCNPTSTLYESNAPQQVSYQGQETANPVNLVTTGRRGERITF